MYRIVVDDHLKKKEIRRGKGELPLAIEASKQREESTFTSATEVGEFEGKISLGTLPLFFDHKGEL